jgi:hypothetical protein
VNRERDQARLELVGHAGALGLVQREDGAEPSALRKVAMGAKSAGTFSPGKVQNTKVPGCSRGVMCRSSFLRSRSPTTPYSP